MARLNKKTVMLAVFLSITGALPADAASELTYNDLLANGNFSAEPGKILTPEQLEQDKKILVYALSKGYPGGFLMRKKVFRGAVKKIEAVACSTGTACTARYACEELAEAVFSIPDKQLFLSVTERQRNGKAVRQKLQ